MIDSVTIRYKLTAEECKELLDSCTMPLPKRITKEMLANFLDVDYADIMSLPKYGRSAMQDISAGLISVRFFRYGHYYFELAFKLEALILGQETVRTFVANPLNIAILQECYADMIKRMFPTVKLHSITIDYVDGNFVPSDNDQLARYNGLSHIPYLALATVVRVDYTINLKVDDKDVYLRLLRKAFLETDRMKLLPKFDGNQNVVATTRSAKIDKSRYVDCKNGKKKPRTILSHGPYTRLTWYDKRLKYQVSDCHDEELLAVAENVVRYEVSLNKVHKWHNDRVCKLLGIEKSGLCGLMPWLDEDVAKHILQSYYDKHIGRGDFYNRYRFAKIIDGADLGYSSTRAEKKRKKELMDISYLISRAKSMRLAKQQYISGTSIGDNRRALHGTPDKFNQLIEQIKATGANPLRLPTDGNTAHMAIYANPYKQYEAGGTANLNGYVYDRDDYGYIYVLNDTDLLRWLDHDLNCCVFESINACNKGLADWPDKPYYYEVNQQIAMHKLQNELCITLANKQNERIIKEIEELECREAAQTQEKD